MDVKENKKIYLFDLDNTLCITEKKEDGNWDYLNAKPIQDRINYVNDLFESGDKIIIETARGSVSKKNWYEETHNQLVSFGLKFHELRTGVKYNFDISIDDKAFNSEDFFLKKTDKILEPCEKEKKINLFCEIFVEKNFERLKEYVYCINKNIKNSNIKKIFLVCYEDLYYSNIEYFENLFTNLIHPNLKIKLILDSNNKRFTFNKFTEICKDYFEDGEIVATTNLDIFFPDDDVWKNIDKDFFIPTRNTCSLSLSRTEYINDDYTFIDQGAWERGEFADAWIFKTPLKLKENSFPCLVPVGSAPTCDNYMFYIMNQEYKKVFNWGGKYKIYHYDLCRKPQVLKEKSGNMILHDDVVELDINWLNSKPEELWRVYPLKNWDLELNKIIFSFMNTTTIEINNKNFHFEYYDKFDEYYKENGKLVEPQTRKWFLENLNSDDIVFDIGAHIGLYSILFSQKTDNVYSFEPTSTHDTLLLPNLERNNITNVKTQKIAFGSESGLLTEKIYKIWGQSPFKDEYQFTTIDDYVKSTGIIPTIIKIDVDGFDYEVLKGGENFLKENSPTLCVEVSHLSLSTRGYTTSVLISYLQNLGYSVKNIFDTENYIFQK
jgi:FkbM family methyltransferase